MHIQGISGILSVICGEVLGNVQFAYFSHSAPNMGGALKTVFIIVKIRNSRVDITQVLSEYGL